EDILELHHAGIGEHQRRVVARHERAGRHDLVAVLSEIVEESRPDFIHAAHIAPFILAPYAPHTAHHPPIAPRRRPNRPAGRSAARKPLGPPSANSVETAHTPRQIAKRPKTSGARERKAFIARLVRCPD